MSEGWRSYISFSGATSLGCALLFNWLSNASAATSRNIESARSLSSLSELEHLDLLPLFVALHGKAASRNAIPCELSSDTAVLHEVKEEHVYMKPSSVTGEAKKEK